MLLVVAEAPLATRRPANLRVEPERTQLVALGAGEHVRHGVGGVLAAGTVVILQSKILKCIKFAHVLKSTFSIARQNCLKFIDYFRRVP